MINSTWSLYSLILVVIALLGVYLWYEAQAVSPKELALVATLAALAGLGRVPFAAIPSAQPTTFLVLVSGYVFGSVPGFMIGSLAAFASNFFLGHGPWTPWQMAAWGLVGVSGGICSCYKGGLMRWLLVLVAFVWGFLFGWILNFWHWLAFVYPLTFKSYLATVMAGVWFDLVHGVTNAIFMSLMGADLIQVLTRFKRRLIITSLPVGQIRRD
ncbi:MAG: ECF transporter S component [bacterium]|jgi:energy-coupling factor transport system substrate-specific component